MSSPLIAVDVGNTRVKFGLFAAPASAAEHLPTPIKSFAVPSIDWNLAELNGWLSDLPADADWWIASVNRPALARLISWKEHLNQATQHTATRRVSQTPRLLKHSDLPIQAAVEHPERVGIDRLAGAAAVNRLRNPQRPAIVVGVGTAITVDFINATGVFCGGAILPGIGMSARALDDFTDLLPRSPLDQLSSPPPALGTSTLAAIHSGLYWGAVGGIRELIGKLGESISGEYAKPEVFLTGGAAPSVAQQLDPTARYVEHLVLSGIALAKIS
jgi:type III pantothenate kinase